MWGHRRVAYKKTVLVNLKTGTTFRGVLYHCYADIIVLKSAQLLQSNTATDVAGDTIIERDNIDFMQVTN